jgi:hypothetical protein
VIQENYVFSSFWIEIDLLLILVLVLLLFFLFLDEIVIVLRIRILVDNYTVFIQPILFSFTRADAK